MTHLRAFPELVRDSELEDVVVEGRITIHTVPLECRGHVLPQHWETLRAIGRGGDGTVFLQKKIRGPGSIDMLVVKEMMLNADLASGLASGDHNSRRYVRELEALAKFAQGRYARHFVRSYGWYQDRYMLYICMEYCKHLDLGSYLKRHTTLSEEFAKIIALQILEGLRRMHDNKIAHRDLKPSNILIHHKPPEDDAWWVVLGDLGLSRRDGASSGTTTIRGSSGFMAPETIGKRFLGQPKDADPFMADMWSLGETISCALTGQGTFSDSEHLLQYQKHNSSFPDESLKASGASVLAIDFIRSLMEVEPSQRLTAVQALKHRWLTGNDISHVHTPSTTTAIPVPEATSSVWKQHEEAIVIETAGNEVLVPNKQNLSIRDQTSQASGQWTQTVPTHSEDIQTLTPSTEIAARSAMQKDSPTLLDGPTVPQDVPETALAQTKDVRGTNLYKSMLFPHDQDTKLEAAAKQSPMQRDILDSFKQFSAAEKLRMSEKQRSFACENKVVKLNDLKKFSQNFKLSTAPPRDLLSLLSNDVEKQKHIEAMNKQRLREMEALPKQRQALDQGSRVEERDKMAASAEEIALAERIARGERLAREIGEMSTPRRPYSNATLLSSTNSDLRPPPEIVRPPPISASKSASPGNRSQPQSHPKAVLERHMDTEKASDLPNPKTVEEWLATKRLITAQSSKQETTPEATDSTAPEAPWTQARGKRRKKKKKSGGQRIEGK